MKKEKLEKPYMRITFIDGNVIESILNANVLKNLDLTLRKWPIKQSLQTIKKIKIIGNGKNWN